MVDERTCNPISTTELQRRWAAVRAAMPEQKLDALIFQGANNLAGTGGYFRWFTGVSMVEGASAITEMSSPFNSSASATVKAATAAFDAV